MIKKRTNNNKQFKLGLYRNDRTNVRPFKMKMVKA